MPLNRLMTLLKPRIDVSCPSDEGIVPLIRLFEIPKAKRLLAFPTGVGTVPLTKESDTEKKIEAGVVKSHA